MILIKLKKLIAEVVIFCSISNQNRTVTKSGYHKELANHVHSAILGPQLQAETHTRHQVLVFGTELGVGHLCMRDIT